MSESNTKKDSIIFSIDFVGNYKSKKRKIEEIENDIVDNNTRNEWSSAEILRFKTGANKFGWGNWRQIASIVQTRTNKEVADFARSARAQRLR